EALLISGRCSSPTAEGLSRFGRLPQAGAAPPAPARPRWPARAQLSLSVKALCYVRRGRKDDSDASPSRPAAGGVAQGGRQGVLRAVLWVLLSRLGRAVCVRRPDLARQGSISGAAPG